MRKIIAYPLSVFYFICFGLLLVLFHPIQWICLKFGGYNAHKQSVDMLNLCLTKCLLLLGTSIHFDCKVNLPKGVPLVIVANHQSMYDIPPIIWYMRNFHAKFISKQELGKGIPSVSFNLRHGGSVLIDRKDPKQAVPAISNFAKFIAHNSYSAVIFPEGTRSRNGVPKPFQTTGLKILFKELKDGYVVPISINNSWKTHCYGSFPMGIGNRIEFKVHQALPIREYHVEELITLVEATVKKDIKV